MPAVIRENAIRSKDDKEAPAVFGMLRYKAARKEARLLRFAPQPSGDCLRSPARPATDGRASAAPALPPPSPPLWKPLPGTPLQLRNSQRGGLSCALIRSAVGGRMPFAADPPQTLRVTALAKPCRPPLPSAPKGLPGEKDKDTVERLHAFASLQHQAQ